MWWNNIATNYSSETGSLYLSLSASFFFPLCSSHSPHPAKTCAVQYGSHCVLCCAVPSLVWLFVTPGTVAHQAPLSMGILQARILEWVAMSSSRGSSQPRDWTRVSHTIDRFFTIWAIREAQRKPKKDWSEVKSLSHVQLFATPWTVAHQAPRSMGFSRQEYWSGLPFPSPGILLTQGLNPGLPQCRQTLYCLIYQGSPSLCQIKWEEWESPVNKEY